MSENENNAILGRKIFFLHPQAYIQNQVIAELAQEEFEVYVAKDEARLRQRLKKYIDSIIFANISEKMQNSNWEEWIRSVISDKENSGVDIGILTSGKDESVRRKYLEQYLIRCGYTVITSDLPTMIKQLVSILNSVNAKGRRKYIRALTEKESNTTVNLPMNGTYVNGVIKDISAVGFSCAFAEDPEISKNSHFADIQIRLQSQLLKVEGIVFGSRMAGSEKLYVILFAQRIDPNIRTRIRKYIQTNLQNKMDNDLR